MYEKSSNQSEKSDTRYSVANHEYVIDSLVQNIKLIFTENSNARFSLFVYRLFTFFIKRNSCSPKSFLSCIGDNEISDKNFSSNIQSRILLRIRNGSRPSSEKAREDNRAPLPPSFRHKCFQLRNRFPRNV